MSTSIKKIMPLNIKLSTNKEPAYSDLDCPRDITVLKISSEEASTTPTAIIAG